MTLFSIRITVAELVTDALSERAAMQYYLASSIISLIAFEFQFWLGPNRDWEPWVDFSANLLILIWGVNHCWRLNGGAGGRDFLKRIVCLSVPVGIRLSILALLAGLLHYGVATVLFTGNYFEAPEQAHRLSNFLLYMALGVYFWRWVALRIRDVARMNP